MMKMPDTINKPHLFNESQPAGFDGLLDWQWTKGCFGSNAITPMDIDAVVERNGQFLIIESKNIGVPVPYGQLLTLKQLHRLGHFTILFIQGKDQPQQCKCWCAPGFHNGLKQLRYRDTSVDQCRSFLRQWWRFADHCQQPPTPFEKRR